MVFAALAMAAAVSQASVDLRPQMTPVQNQGGARNTCSAFAAAGLMEFLIQRETGKPVHLSENWIYARGKSGAPAMYERIDGLAGFLAVRALRDGVLPASAWPYESVKPCPQAEGAPTECYTGRIPRDFKLLPYHAREHYIERTKIADQLATEKTPVAMNIQLYPALIGPKGDFTRLPTEKEKTACRDRNEGCGGHVILITGYDSVKDRFSFRNSWGTSWGDGGYGTLPRAWIEDHCEICYTLEHPERLSAVDLEFARTVSMGVSATLR